jgi:hypothetical protein
MIDDTTVKLKWGTKVVCTAREDDTDPCDGVICPEGETLRSRNWEMH